MIKFHLFTGKQKLLSSKLYIKMRLIDNLIKFAKETSIHGFVQIADSSSSKIKRISWFIIFCSSLLYARYQISDEVRCKYHTYYVFYSYETSITNGYYLNKPQVNEFTLRGINLSLKCCQPLELFTYFERGLRSLIQIIQGLEVIGM